MKHGDFFFSNMKFFCQMIFDKCSIKMPTQFILIAHENYVFGTFFCIFAIDMFKKK